MTSLPIFRFHPDPMQSGSIVASEKKCKCCSKKRGYIYTGPVYAEKDLDQAICPWCIADGSAHKKWDATFVDCDAFRGEPSQESMDEVCERTPGYSGWQQEEWPTCCGEAAAFIEPTGIEEIRAKNRDLEGAVLSHVIYNMSISGGAATRLVQNLKRDQSPTAYVFRCLKCEAPLFHIDQL